MDDCPFRHYCLTIALSSISDHAIACLQAPASLAVYSSACTHRSATQGELQMSPRMSDLISSDDVNI